MSKKTNSGEIFQLKITLVGSEPEIWRRILVHKNTSLMDLHFIIQKVMGWDGYHMHEFRIKGEGYGPKYDDFAEYEGKDESKVDLDQLAMKTIRKFFYEYDFGDGWKHEVKIEKRPLPVEKGLKYPVCIEGEKACPPEDCGGIYGFYDKLQTLSDPKSEDNAQIREWMGNFNPDKFSIEKVNQQLSTR